MLLDAQRFQNYVLSIKRDHYLSEKKIYIYIYISKQSPLNMFDKNNPFSFLIHL